MAAASKPRRRLGVISQAGLAWLAMKRTSRVR
jgi:hypothetical protein